MQSMQRPSLAMTQQYKQFKANYFMKKQTRKFWAYKIIDLSEVINFCKFVQTYKMIDKRAGILNNLGQITMSFDKRAIYIKKYENIMNNVEKLIRSIDMNAPNYGLASEIIYLSNDALNYKTKYNLFVGGRRKLVNV